MLNGTVEVDFTYSVKFEFSDLQWASRLDHYLSMEDDLIHWVYIINSILIIVIFATLIAQNMNRVLKRDLTQYELFKKR